MKTLQVPGKRWGSAREFLREFPNLKVPLFISVYPLVDHPYLCRRTSRFDVAKRIRTYKNMVKYAINRQFPITFYSNVREDCIRRQCTGTDYVDVSGTGDSQVIRTVTAYLPCEARNAFNAYAAGQPKNWCSSSCIVSRSDYQAWYNRFGAKVLCAVCADCAKVSIGKRGVSEAFKRVPVAVSMFAAVAARFICEGEVNRFYSGVHRPQALAIKNVIYNKYDRVIDAFFDHMVTGFEAYTPVRSIDFEEFYGVSDPSKLPPRSISYVVVGDPPPLDKKVWNNLKFWSQLFARQPFLAMLQAAAENYPVKVRVPAPFQKGSGSFQKLVKKLGAGRTLYKTILEYMINDFVIEVDPELRIIVKYVRDIRKESAEVIKVKRKTWRDYVGKFIALAGITAAGVGLATSLASMATAAKGVTLPKTLGGAFTKVKTAVSTVLKPAEIAKTTAQTVATAAKTTATAIAKETLQQKVEKVLASIQKRPPVTPQVIMMPPTVPLVDPRQAMIEDAMGRQNDMISKYGPLALMGFAAVATIVAASD